MNGPLSEITSSIFGNDEVSVIAGGDILMNTGSLIDNNGGTVNLRCRSAISPT